MLLLTKNCCENVDDDNDNDNRNDGSDDDGAKVQIRLLNQNVFFVNLKAIHRLEWSDQSSLAVMLFQAKWYIVVAITSDGTMA